MEEEGQERRRRTRGHEVFIQARDIPELCTSRLRLSHELCSKAKIAPVANNQDSHGYPYQTGAPKDPNIDSRIQFHNSIISIHTEVVKSCHQGRNTTSLQPMPKSSNTNTEEKLDSGRLQGRLSKVTHLNVGLNVGLAIEQGGLLSNGDIRLHKNMHNATIPDNQPQSRRPDH